MEAEEELATLADLVSWLELAESAQGVIDLLSTIREGRPSPKPCPDIFPISGLGGIPFGSKAQYTPRLSRFSRLGISLGLNSDTIQLAFTFGPTQASRPQTFMFVPPPRCYILPIGGKTKRDG